MKKLIIVLIFLLIAILLASCSGGVGVASSWPGVTIGPDGETAYIANNNHVYAVNLSNGSEIWRYPGKADNKITFYSPPGITEDGSLIVGSYDKNVYKLNLENGSESQSNWPFSESDHRIVSAIRVYDGLVYIPSTDRNLYVVDLEGNLKWTFKAEQALWAPPAYVDGIIYLSSMDRQVYALDSKTGNLIWKSPDVGGAMVGEPSLDDNLLFVGTFGSEMVALNRGDGSIAWKFKATGWVWSGPAYDEGVVYFGDLNGAFYAVDASTGKEKWSLNPDKTGVNGAIASTPVVINGHVYYTSEDGILFAVDKTNGNPKWNKTMEGNLLAPALVVNDLILVTPASSDNLMLAFNPEGNQVWFFNPAK